MDNMEPKLTIIDGFNITGLQVSTSNQDEFNPSTAKLSVLWGRFYSDNLPANISGKVKDSTVYGVYSEYQSDAHGLYTVTAGVKTVLNHAQDKFQTVSIASGHYLCFSNKGLMPQAAISAWQQVWGFFNHNQTYKRNFKTDFEAYPNHETISIYIGLDL